MCFQSNSCGCLISVTQLAHFLHLAFVELSILRKPDVGRGLEASRCCLDCGWADSLCKEGRGRVLFSPTEGWVFVFTAADAELSLNK